MKNYVPLHIHSEYSFLDGYSKVESIAHRVHELGQSAVALTDHQECSGHVAFEKACKKVNVKPIFGMEGYLVNDINRVKEEKDNKNSHLCIFAENQVGLKNLWTVSSLAYLKGLYYRALTDWAMLDQYKKGLIVTDGCGLADMSRYINNNDWEGAKNLATQYLSIFGEEHFFMELHTFQFINPTTDKHFVLNEQMKKMNQGKVAIATELGIPLIVVNDAHYSRKEDWDNHALVWAINTSQIDQVESGQAASWIMSNEEIFFWMDKHGIDKKIIEEAIDNTAWIGERCNVEIERKPHIPMLTSSKEEDLNIYQEAIEKGIQEKVISRGLDPTPYRERVNKENELILERELYGYYDVVADYTQWAKNQKMLVAAGRGSAAGSLVAYLMSINEIDPLAYGLLFERFLNPGREDFPDIDGDFPQSRRQEVKDYLSQKYGEDKVCSIGNFSHLKPLAAIADIARALAIPYADSRTIAKIIEKVKSETEDVRQQWAEILEIKRAELSPWIEQYPLLFKKMEELVGLIRQSGTHASGVLISDESLIGLLPLRLKADKVTTQFDMYTIAELGFIKFDILGIRHLDTLTETWKIINNSKDFDPNFYYQFKNEYSDSNVWDMISAGKTTGIFQVESPDMTRVAKQLCPKNERDIATLISINRPGVIRAGMLDQYLKRRSGKKEVTTPHPLMTEILHDTYGVVVYQEQVMEIAQVLANYSLIEADKVRWMMGKKHAEMMRETKPQFIQRCIENPKFVELCTRDPAIQASECWQQIEASGSYSFGRGHAQGYSLTSSWGSYMRHHHFLEYLVACLITDPDNVNKYIRELRKEGYSILPPDINLSGNRFTLANNGVRYGLEDLKHVGKAAFKEIIENRPFSSFEDFLNKVDKRACGKRVVEVLIKIGAFDSLGTRQELLRDYYRGRKIDQVIPDFSNPAVIELIELEIVGNYITRDPLERYIPMIDENCIDDPDIIEQSEKGTTFFIGGVISKLKEWNAKNGLMAFLEIEWLEQNYSVTIFADTYGLIRNDLILGKPIICEVERVKRGCMMKQMIRLDLV